MAVNKANVKIYGQEYTISGDMTKDDILKIAAHVDMKMQDIADAAGGTPPGHAILAAVNITSEYFDEKKKVEEYKQINAQLDKDTQHYVQLWDETKKNYNDYKEETQYIAIQKDEMLAQLKAKDEEINYLKEAVENAKSQAQSGMNDIIDEIEARCKELENSFFDLQMENLQLRKELDKYKNKNK